MNRHLWHLLFRSARGRIIRALRLVRQPKYLVGFLVTAIWMGIWLVPPIFSSNERGAPPPVEQIAEYLPAAQLLTALAMALLLTLWWLVPIGKPSLGLSEAEIEMLSPAPLRRRHLIQYSIVKTQPQILFGCLVMTVFLPFQSWGAEIYHFCAIWLLLSLWDLHSRSRRLWLGGVRQLSGGRAAKRWAGLYLTASLYLAALAFSFAPVKTLAATFSTSDLESVLKESAALALELKGGPAGWLLWPFLQLTEPFAANISGAGAADRLLSLAFPVLLLALHNEWAVRSRTRFEEASLEAARRKSRDKAGTARHLIQAGRARSRVPFALSPGGLPETGVFWKNLIAVRRTPLTRQALIGGFAATSVGVAAALFPLPDWTLAVPLISGLILLFSFPLLGPGNWRNDLRSDLKRVETIRCWPIPGWRLAAVEALGPGFLGLAYASLGAALLLALDWGALWGGRGLEPVGEALARLARFTATPRPLVTPLLLLGLLPLSAAVAYFASALQNFAAVAFPGWVPLGPVRGQGAARAGHNILLALILMTAMLLGFVPGLLLAGLTAGLQYWLGIPVSAWEFPLLGVLASLPLFLFSALLIAACGKLWERLDPSQELLTD